MSSLHQSHSVNSFSAQDIIKHSLQDIPSSSDIPPQSKPEKEEQPHLTIDFERDNPPPFGPYEAEYFITDEGDIITHDSHLNEDGEALYQFINAQAMTPPSYILSCSGSHREQRTRIVNSTVNGQRTQRIESYTVTIVDFSIRIDLSPLIVTGPIHWSYADTEPAYRGLMVRQVETPQGRRKATSEEIDSFKEWEHHREANGLAPWIGRDGRTSLKADESSHTLRQWADEYGASPKYLKELVYEKVVHGWDIKKLEEAIRNAIRETQYRGEVDISFDIARSKICVRADNRLSRTLSKTFYKVLLIIFLIYPFIWLFKRYSSRGGGRWEICGGAYALKHIEPLGVEELGNDIAHSDGPTLSPRIVDTENGPAKLIGVREGEWFKQWEPIIKRSVVTGLQDSTPMKSIADGPINPASALDGFTAD